MAGWFNPQSFPRFPMRVGKKVPGGTWTSDEWGLPAAGRRLPSFGGGGGGGGTGLKAGLPGIGGGAKWEQTGFHEGGDGERVAFGLGTFRRVDGGAGAGGTGLPKMGPHLSAAASSGGGAGAGGGGFATYEDRPRLPIVSARDGTTTARQSGGFGGLNEFYANNEHLTDPSKKKPFTYGGHTSTGEGYWNGAPMMAEGGAMSPLQPFIAGDPQADGKANPELILPTPQGTHVIPLKDIQKLPKFGDGTPGGGQKDRTPRVDGRKIISKGALKPGSGLAEFYAKNPQTPTAALAEFLKHANASDYKVSGHGSPGLLKLPDLPKKAYGTVMGDEHDPSLLVLKENPYGTGHSFGAPMPEAAPDPNVVPVSELPAGSRVPAMRDPFGVSGFESQVSGSDIPARPVPAGKSAFETWAQFDARMREMNPEGITVGVTPREALRPVQLPQMDGQSREERAFARMERDVLRAARRNPALAYRLLQDREAMSAAEAVARGREAMERFKQGQLNQRNQAGIDAANARAEAARKVRADEQAVAHNFKLAEESRKALEVAQSMAQPQFVPVAGSGGGVVMKGDKLASGFVPSPQAGVDPRMVPIPGTNMAVPYNGNERITGLPDFEMTQPARAPLNFPQLNPMMPPMPIPGTGQPAQYKPVEGKDALKPPAVKNFGTTEAPDWREWDASKGGWRKVKFVDVDGDGVPDPVPVVSGGFMNAVK